MAKAKLNRRDFLKAATAAGASLGLMSTGLVFASAEEGETEATETAALTQITSTLQSTAKWRIKPEAIDDSQISATYEADVCVLGMGHSGAPAATEIAESGFTVIGIETQEFDSYSPMGNDFGHINSELSASLGGQTDVDPVEFYQNWMLNCANAANPTLAMKFAQNSGEAIDWWYAKANGEAEAKLVFEPANEERPNIVTEVGPFHFYCTSVNFNDAICVKNAVTQMEEDNEANKFFFGYSACQLIQEEDGTVTGAIAQSNETGEYIKIVSKAVVLATGGFGGDEEMCDDLLVDLNYMLQDNDAYRLMGMDRDGAGIKMGYWAGGKLEQNPPTNDGRASWQTSSPALVPMLSHPQGIHLDYTGRRFYDEYWGPIETRSRPLTTRNRELFYAVFDDNLTEYMGYVPASHGCTNPTTETLAGVREIMDAAYAVKGTGYLDERSEAVWYAGDTIEEIVEAMGLDEKVANNIIKSVESWNACVEAGADSEFGRDSNFLFPLNQAPYYIQVNENNIKLGNFLVTNGGLIVDGDQRVLGDKWKPIPGLFASGNNTGGRFGWDYFSPCYGVSVGSACTLGRECGKSVVQYLNDELV